MSGFVFVSSLHMYIYIRNVCTYVCINSCVQPKAVNVWMKYKLYLCCCFLTTIEVRSQMRLFCSPHGAPYYWISSLCFSLHTNHMKTESHMCTCTRGYLAPLWIPYPAQRAIVVKYDNELNMPSSGMCENGEVSVEKCPLSHSLKAPVAPQKHDWHTNAFVPPFGGQRLAGGWAREGTLAAAQNPQWPYAEEMEERPPRAPKVNCRSAGTWALISDQWVRKPAPGLGEKALR